MYAAEVLAGVSCQYPCDRASQISPIGATVKASRHDFNARGLDEILIRPTAQAG